ncbi:MAG: aromatic ring-hydroxylating dioxygenase subunit alpha [Pseudomonadota bacterium]
MTLTERCSVQPLNEASALHPSFYTDPQWLAAEQQGVFMRGWQLASHSGELAGVGDHVVCEVAGKPILIVRNPDLSLRAFYNVCRHRAGPVASCKGKGAKTLQCAYHGWTYALDGQLRAATEMQSAINFNVAGMRLPGVQVREWQGLVFVALSDEAPAFEAVFGGIAPRIAPIDIGEMRFAKRETYVIDCNWKVYVDNYLEGYHLPYVHPGLTDQLDYRAYETEVHEWDSLQHSPIRTGNALYGEGNAFYYFVYPNTMFNITPGRLQTNRVVPLGHARCSVEFDYYYSDSAQAQARAQAEQAFSHEVQLEDIGICVQVQKGLASGAYEAGRLNPKRESGVWHFQNLLRADYARAAKDGHGGR